MQSGNFSYDDASITNTMTISGSTITEYIEGGSVVSTLTWNSDCSYTATVQSYTMENFPYAIGDQMSVTIDNVVGSKVFLTSSIGGDSWESVLVKV